MSQYSEYNPRVARRRPVGAIVIGAAVVTARRLLTEADESSKGGAARAGDSSGTNDLTLAPTVVRVPRALVQIHDVSRRLLARSFNAAPYRSRSRRVLEATVIIAPPTLSGSITISEGPRPRGAHGTVLQHVTGDGAHRVNARARYPRAVRAAPTCPGDSASTT